MQIPRISMEQVDIRATLELILKNAVLALGGSAGVVATWNEAEHRFVTSAAYGLSPATLESLKPLLDEAAPDLAVSRESFNFLSELRPDIELPVSESGLKQNPIIALPLKIGERTIGLIYILRPMAASAFSRIDQPILAAFAEQAAIAIQNAWLVHLLAEEKQRLESILENSADGIMSIDSRCHILGFNAAMEKLTGYGREEVLGKTCSLILKFRDKGKKSICNVQCPMSVMLNEQKPVIEQEGVIYTKDGREVDVVMVYSIVRSPAGNPVNAVVNVHDVSKLREVENLREAILSMLGHELQTPLAIIKGYTSTLTRRDKPWDIETLQQGLQVIEEESDRLSKLMNKLLLASRLSSGALKLEKEPVQLPAIAQKVVNRLKTLTGKHVFRIEFNDEFPVIEAEPQLMEQVLSNLIENAIKYSPNGGTVTISGRVLDNRVEIAVEDQGIGIPLSEMDNLFKRFSRVERGLNRRIQGVGLGLYICKSIIEAHGGEMKATSQPGAGSRFSFTLPLYGDKL